MAWLFETLKRWLNSPAFKLGLISFIILLLLIPLLVVNGLVSERQSRVYEVRSEVGRTWGPEQRLNGPFLIVPYTTASRSMQGDKQIETLSEHHALFMPETLLVEGNLDTKTLRRSIFDVPVYSARLKLSGRFATPRISDVVTDPRSVRWRDATIVLGLSGVSGLKDMAVVKIAGAKDAAFEPSIGLTGSNTAGIHAKLVEAGPSVIANADAAPAPFDFSIDLALNGSVSFDIAPVAKETRVMLASNWPHPSFGGAFLPDDRQITRSGFKSSWKVPHLARSVAQSGVVGNSSIERLSAFAFGVRMIEPVDFYAQVNRATKYGFMFLVLAFMAMFCLELIVKRPVHPVQYLFTGIALVFFYALLLSLAEHIGFAVAYMLAATATGVMLAVYTGTILRSRRLGGILLAVFIVIYVFLYLILRLEDYALLVGALLGFVALTFVMFATLRVEWSGQRADAGKS